MKKLTATMAVMLAVTALATTAQAEIILQNGDFETPVVPDNPGYVVVGAGSTNNNWTATGQDMYYIDRVKYGGAWYPDSAVDGTQCMQVRDGGGMYQSLGTVAAGEKDITLSFSHALRSDHLSATITIGLYDAATGGNTLGETSFSNGASGTWVVGSVAALDVAVGTDVYARFAVTGTSNQTLFDATSVSVVPEPSVFILTAIGLVGLALVRRRRKQRPLWIA